MKDKLLIIGAGGHGKVAADIAQKMGMWQEIAFLDDSEVSKSFMGMEVIGKTSDAFLYKEKADFFVAIGGNIIREKTQEKLLNKGLTFAKLIHPSAVIGLDVEIGEGSIVVAGAIINSSTIIGKGCIINTNSSVGHDSIVKDYVHIAPGVSIAGTVSIEKGSWIGIGSAVRNNINICSNSIVGAGSVVVKDIVKPGKYVGVPVRSLNK